MKGAQSRRPRAPPPAGLVVESFSPPTRGHCGNPGNRRKRHKSIYSSDGRTTAAMKKTTIPMKSKTASKEAKGGDAPSQLIDARIAALADWRGETLARVRSLIREADLEVVEEVKWRKPSNSMLGVPVWSHAGIICTGETYKNAVKVTFAKGASLDDPSGLFNSSLEGNTRRAVDFHEGDAIDAKALKTLIRAAVALNTSTTTPK